MDHGHIPTIKHWPKNNKTKRNDKTMMLFLWLPTNSAYNKKDKLPGWMIFRIVSVITNYDVIFLFNFWGDAGLQWQQARVMKTARAKIIIARVVKYSARY
jgi:hypothetical protein